ncbi:unnamed protein product [Blepharisma stoltei]|uniref:Protein kinase domain-containing protein n=1 Tax=Blepharisma stoltei TaxID=1481888 RepID=A0AAU9J7D3_9CILI|nr:unnamed protein product [Blepharisma stoltei]
MGDRNYKQVSHYLLKEELGNGTFGTVYRGKDLNTNEIRAIKMISAQNVLKPQEKKALSREIQIMRNLDHENIVKLYDYLETRNYNYLVLEYCSGGDLSGLRDLSEEHTIIYLRQIVSALKVLQANNIIHRDLKPANILLSDKSPDAKIKLADFGLARQISANSLAKSYVGTPLYMAPEVIKLRENQSERYTERADIWSVGCIVYELIRGARPFEAKNFGDLLPVIKTRLNDPDFLSSQYFSEPCIDFLSKIFKINPKERMDFETMCDHPFILGRPSIKPIIDLHGIQCMSEDFELSTKEDALDISEVLFNLAKDTPHPFLFYMKACTLLEPYLEDQVCASIFKVNFDEAKRCKNKTDWESSTMTRLILEMAVKLCRSDENIASHLLKENYRQALTLLNSLGPSSHIIRLKEAIKRQMDMHN